MKKWVKDYLQFSKKERIGLLVVLFLLGSFIVLPYLIPSSIPPLQHSDTAWVDQVKTSPLKMPYPKDTASSRTTSIKPVFFNFDPNTASEEELQLLGLSFKNAQTIIRYRQKGGRFKTPLDLLKIWGIDPSLANKLLPYIRVHSRGVEQNYTAVNERRGYNPPYTPQKISIIDINTASMEDWEALPGIGPVLAARIIKYRDKLGGFSEIDDIKKTYGIRDSLFTLIQPYLKIHALGKPSINSASQSRLIKAGVSPEIAAAIIQYRSQYGLFGSLEELKKIVFIQPAQYQLLIDLVKL